MAILLDHVTKRYRKRSLVTHYGSLKSLVLRRQPNDLFGEQNYHTVFEDLTLHVQKKACAGVIGENGSGKTTLLKLMAKILTPDAGRVTVNGRVSALIELGAGFHPDFTGRENIFLNGTLLGWTKGETRQKLDSIIDFAGLRAFIDDQVRTYSSGMFMRLGFSVAVHVDPDILLIDEVLSVGDEAFNRKCREKMEQFRRQGKTMILVSHDLGMVGQWCDEAFWLGEGRIRAQGDTQMVIQRYLAFVEARRREAQRQAEEGARAAASSSAPVEEQQESGGESDDLAAPTPGAAVAEAAWPAQVTRIRLLNERGEEQAVVQSGQRVSIEIGYQINVPAVERPVLDVSIWRRDEQCCFATGTAQDGITIPRLSGSGALVLDVESLELLRGAYYIMATFAPPHGSYEEALTRPYIFSVQNPDPGSGVQTMGHRWRRADGATGDFR